MLTKSRKTAAECEGDLLCGVNIVGDVDKASDLEKKHLPVISAPRKVKKGECFEVGHRGAVNECAMMKRKKAVEMAKVEDTRENFRICMQGNCSTCPSYPKGKGEGLYCGRAPSTAKVEKRGCNCPECPVWMDNGLSSMYYCLQGPPA